MASRPAPPPPSTRSRASGSSSSSGRGPKARVGQYILERTLGSGSFGKVKLATHAVTGHQVALKFVNRAKISAPDMNTRVYREIAYLKFLRHPHIIKLYEVIETSTDVIMVMEYAGEELFNYIVSKGRRGMTEDEARRLFQQMIAALEYCHKHNIVHRDLKPENLLLDHYRNIKVGDFGLSNLMTDGDFLKTSCGSPNYAAPEVISGRLYSGPEIDVWSSGVIMFVLLAGKLPFDDDHIPSLFKKIEHGTFTMPEYLSDGAKHLISRMLTVDPVKRATIAEIRNMPFFQENLPRYLQPLPVIDTYPTLPMDDMATLLLVNEGQAKPQEIAEAKGMTYVKDIGIIDPSIVTELVNRISDYTHESVTRSLSLPEHNQVKVAYQLVRDHKRILRDTEGMDDEDTAMQGFRASSPPAWNAAMPRAGSMRSASLPEMEEEAEWDEGDEIQDIPNAHFDVLQVTGAADTNVPTRPMSSLIPNLNDKMPKPRWHFGIRSRSPPMEVMLEVYKTLSTLGFQWTKKEGIDYPDIGQPPLEGYNNPEVEAVLQGWATKHGKPYAMGQAPPSKRVIVSRERAAQDLYLLQTRARYASVVVRMDLQLYQVDRENFLVDFKNIGYYPATEADMQDIPEANTAALESRQGDRPGHAQSASVSESTSAPGSAKKSDSIGGVSGPFHFLEMACQMIAELAA